MKWGCGVEHLDHHHAAVGISTAVVVDRRRGSETVLKIGELILGLDTEEDKSRTDGVATETIGIDSRELKPPRSRSAEEVDVGNLSVDRQPNKTFVEKTTGCEVPSEVADYVRARRRHNLILPLLKGLAAASGHLSQNAPTPGVCALSLIAGTRAAIDRRAGYGQANTSTVL